MKTVKRILYKILPQGSFLRSMHRSFYFMFDAGLLKHNKEYKFHHMVKHIIERDSVIVDIGANLGYFTRNFARLARQGKVLAIEPIPPFFDVLKYFLKRYPHVEIINCALGNETGKVTMVMPSTDGVLRTGLPHIPKDKSELTAHKTQEVDLLVGSEILGKLAKIDYIKCDIEGYEPIVFEEIREIIKTKRPIVQIEIGPENEERMLKYFEELNYVQYGIADFKLIRETGKQKEQGDFLFVPEEKTTSFEAKVRASGKLV
jgi:FkbM family methyltransferase